jgi:pilus assembly protein FimV
VAAAGDETGFPLRSGPIKPGSGLWRTARNLTPPGATVAQAAMALYRNNQQAFVRGDINKLRQGTVLGIPTSAELFAMDPATAEGVPRPWLASR